MEWTDKENCIAVIAFHKREIERAHIFDLVNLLNNMDVFVYHTVKLFLDTGGVSDTKDLSGLAWFVHHRLLTSQVGS